MKNLVDGRKQTSGVPFRDASSLYCETLGRLLQGIKMECFATWEQQGKGRFIFILYMWDREGIYGSNGCIQSYSKKCHHLAFLFLFALDFFPSLEVESQYDAQGDLNHLGARRLLPYPFDCLE